MCVQMGPQTIPLSFSYAAYQLHLLLPRFANHWHSLWASISDMGRLRSILVPRHNTDYLSCPKDA